MPESTRAIELRRLGELEKQAAMFGPNTDPAILIEIQDLHHKLRGDYSERRRYELANLDYDFLMNTVAAALLRLTHVENKMALDTKSRELRQLIHDVWMVVMTFMVFLMVFLLLTRH